MSLIRRREYKKATAEFLDHWKKAAAHLGEMEDIITLMWYYEHDVLRKNDELAELVITAADLFDDAMLRLSDVVRKVEQISNLS